MADQQPILLNLSLTQRAALKMAAEAKHLTESAYLRRALSTALRLDAFTEEPAAYQSWFRDGLSDLYAAADASATLAYAAVSLILDGLSEDDDGPLDARRVEISHRIAQAREAIPALDTAIAWHSTADIDGPEFAEFRHQVQGQRGRGRKKKKSLGPL